MYRVPGRSPNSIDLSSPSMCLSNDNKLPNEYVQSYSIIATTGGSGGDGGRSMKRPTGVRIRARVEGEERDVNTIHAAVAEYARIFRDPRGMGGQDDAPASPP